MILWYWLGLQLTYWAFVFFGIRRFDRSRASAGGDSGKGGADFQLVVPVFNELRHLPMIEQKVADAEAADIATWIVDDGSSDGSADRLAELCRDTPARLLRHAVNYGKAAALQTGLAEVTTPVALLVDADTIVPTDSVRGVDMAANVGAVAFTIAAIGNSSLAVMQACEYEYILNFDRQALAGFGIVLTVPGAASLWRTDSLSAIGGFSSRTEAEDTDATLALQAAGWRVAVCDIVAHTECPATLAGLIRQRGRWIWGNLQAARYAIVEAYGKASVVTRKPALAIAMASALNVLGYGVATMMIVRVFILDVGMADLIAGGLLCVATVGRVEVARRLRRLSRRGLFELLANLLLMQIVNLVAFWHGGLTRLLHKRAW